MINPVRDIYLLERHARQLREDLFDSYFDRIVGYVTGFRFLANSAFKIRRRNAPNELRSGPPIQKFDEPRWIAGHQRIRGNIVSDHGHCRYARSLAKVSAFKEERLVPNPGKIADPNGLNPPGGVGLPARRSSAS